MYWVGSGEDWGGDGKRRGSSGENSTSWVQFGGGEEDLVQKSTSDRFDLMNNRLKNATHCLIFQHI